MQQLPCLVSAAIGEFLAPSPTDATLCCDTNMRTAGRYHSWCKLSKSTREEFFEFSPIGRVRYALYDIEELRYTCRWSDAFYTRLVATAEFAPMLARLAQARLLQAAPPPGPEQATPPPCDRHPPDLRGTGTELHLAVASGYSDVVRLAATRCPALLDVPDSFGETALFKACTLDYDDENEAARTLLELRADPNAASGDVAGWDGQALRCPDHYNPRTPLLMACALGNIDLVDLLLEGRADPSGACSALSEATTPLAAMSMGPRALECAMGTDPRHHTLQEDLLHAARALLAARADVEGPSRAARHRTPAWLAARDGRTEVLRLLLEHRASPNATEPYGHTALHVAYWSCHTEGVRLLLDARADADALDANGTRPEEIAGQGVPRRP